MKTLYHLQVARAAFEPYLTPRGVDWILRGNFNTDFYGAIGWMILLKKVFPLYPIARHWYKEIDHMDQMGTYDVVLENWRELCARVRRCADDELYPPQKVKAMFIALGRASHSLTDIYAHSNYVELLYEYYKNEGAAEVEQSDTPMPGYVGKHAPTFSTVLDQADDKFSLLTKKYLKPNLYTFDSVPDEGPRCHEENAKDNPESNGSLNPDCPEIFVQVMALAHRDIPRIFKEFFDSLQQENPEKYKSLTSAFPGELEGPGPFERRAKYWSDKFDAWD